MRGRDVWLGLVVCVEFCLRPTFSSSQVPHLCYFCICTFTTTTVPLPASHTCLPPLQVTLPACVNIACYYYLPHLLHTTTLFAHFSTTHHTPPTHTLLHTLHFTHTLFQRGTGDFQGGMGQGQGQGDIPHCLLVLPCRCVPPFCAFVVCPCVYLPSHPTHTGPAPFPPPPSSSPSPHHPPLCHHMPFPTFP